MSSLHEESDHLQYTVLCSLACGRAAAPRVVLLGGRSSSEAVLTVSSWRGTKLGAEEGDGERMEVGMDEAKLVQLYRGLRSIYNLLGNADQLIMELLLPAEERSQIHG